MKTIETNLDKPLTPLEILKEHGIHAGPESAICPEKSARLFFESWLNNNMAVLLMLAEHTKIKPREKQIEKLLCFLDTIQNYYVYPKQAAVFAKALEYLKTYLKDYPLVDAARSERAAAMIRHLYVAMGLQIRSGLNRGGSPA